MSMDPCFPPFLRLNILTNHPNRLEMSVIASVIGLVGIVYALRAIRRHWNKYDASFVTLHAATSSPILPPSSATAGSSLTQLIRDKVPALGATASFNGAWWLPGYELDVYPFVHGAYYI